MRVLYDGGLVVEPSGAAAFAAFLNKKIPDIKADAQVVVFLTGSNVTVDELHKFIGKTT
jgi:threonine dehydratase